MMRRAESSRPHGFTLVEMLAVVVLLSLIASVAAVSLARSDRGGAMQSARWGLMNLDAQARIAARTEGCGVIIRSVQNGSRLVADVQSAAADRWSSSVVLPTGVRIAFFDGQVGRGEAAAALLIDRTGRSADRTIGISIESGPSEQWLLCGLTGQFSRLDSGGGI